MSTPKRKQRLTSEKNRPVMAFITCPYCLKRGYSSRKAARDAMKQMDDPAAFNLYRCQSRPTYAGTDHDWHIGHVVPRRFRETGATEC